MNNRRSLWVMKHADPAAVARAIESLAGSEKTQEITSKAIATLRQGDSFDEFSTPQKTSESGGVGLGPWDDVTGSPRSPFQGPPPGRYRTGDSSKYGSLAVGFQRQSSGGNNERRLHSPWNQSQRNNSFTQSQPPSGFGRPPPRQGYQRGSGRYRNAISDFNVNPYISPDDVGSSRPRPSYHYSRDQHPIQPLTPSRGSGQRGSSHWSQRHASDASSMQQMPVSPLIHLTEASVTAWNEQVMDFYAVIRLFVEKHASMPDYSSLVQLGRTTLWPTLLATYLQLSEPEATSYLDFHLKEESCKSGIVTRVVIDYVVNRVWVPAAWIGSDRETSAELMRLEDDLEATAGKLLP